MIHSSSLSQDVGVGDSHISPFLLFQQTGEQMLLILRFENLPHLFLLFMSAWIHIFKLIMWFSSSSSLTLSITKISLFNFSFVTSFFLLHRMLKTSPKGVLLKGESHNVTTIIKDLSWFFNVYKKELQLLHSSKNSLNLLFPICKCHLLKPMKSTLQPFHILCSSISEWHAYLSPYIFIHAKSSSVRSLPQGNLSVPLSLYSIPMLSNNSGFLFSEKQFLSYFIHVPFVFFDTYQSRFWTQIPYFLYFYAAK